MTSIRFALLFSILVMSACANSDSTPSEAHDGSDYDRTLAEMGSEVYLRSCASCHGIDGTGDGPVTPSMAIAPTDLTRIAERHDGKFPDGKVARYIDGRFETPAHGTQEMPVWGERFSELIPEASLSEEISRGKIATLIEYLKSIQRSE
jgi:mono/diheme cytochrome c family protein